MSREKWDAMRAELKEREEQYGIENNPSFNPMAMGLYAEIKNLQRRMDELDEEYPDRD